MIIFMIRSSYSETAKVLAEGLGCEKSNRRERAPASTICSTTTFDAKPWLQLRSGGRGCELFRLDLAKMRCRACVAYR